MSAGDTPLLTIERERGGEAVRIEPGAMFSVGRAADADFVITDDPHVSAMHFRLHCRDAEWWLEDLGSRNGTYVNGVPVRQTVVHHHDRIAVGDTAFRVSIQAGSRGEAPLSENVVAGEIVNRTPFSVGTAYAEDAGGASITLPNRCALLARYRPQCDQYTGSDWRSAPPNSAYTGTPRSLAFRSRHAFS